MEIFRPFDVFWTTFQEMNLTFFIRFSTICQSQWEKVVLKESAVALQFNTVPAPIAAAGIISTEGADFPVLDSIHIHIK